MCETTAGLARLQRDTLHGHCDGPMSEARFYTPRGICYNAYDDCIYIADSCNHCIRRLHADSGVSTIAGFSHLPGHVDGSAAMAKFHHPCAVSAAADGSLYVAEFGNHTIRHISADRTHIRTVAGVPGDPGFSSGAGNESRFCNPMSLVVADNVGFVFISDHGNHAIRRLCMRTYTVDTIAGTGFPGYSIKNEIGENSHFHNPQGLAWNAKGNDGHGSLYVADSGNNCVRKLRFHSGAGYYEVTQIAGSGFSGFADGPALEARFEAPVALAYHEGSLYISDEVSGSLRVLSRVAPTALGYTRRNFVYTVVSSCKLLAGPGLGDGTVGAGVAVARGSIMVSDCATHCIRGFVGRPEYRAFNFAFDVDDGLYFGDSHNLLELSEPDVSDFSDGSMHSDSTDDSPCSDSTDGMSELSIVSPARMWQHKKMELLEREVDALKIGFMKMMDEVESLKDENRKLRNLMKQ